MIREGRGFDMSTSHEADAEALRVQIFRRMTFLQKWEKVSELRRVAWSLKAARFRSLHPEWTESQVQDEVRKVFLYGTT